jgi:hypothetical protein
LNSFLEEIRQLTTRQLVAVLAGGVLVGIGFIPTPLVLPALILGVVLVVASVFFARSVMDALSGLALAFMAFAGIVLLLATVGLILYLI